MGRRWNGVGRLSKSEGEGCNSTRSGTVRLGAPAPLLGQTPSKSMVSLGREEIADGTWHILKEKPILSK